MANVSIYNAFSRFWEHIITKLNKKEDKHIKLTQAEYDVLSNEEKNNGKMYLITDANEVGEAGQISYDNTSSGLSATTVQSAVDELNSTKVGEYTVLYSDYSATTETKSFTLSNDKISNYKYLIISCMYGKYYIDTQIVAVDLILKYNGVKLFDGSTRRAMVEFSDTTITTTFDTAYHEVHIIGIK